MAADELLLCMGQADIDGVLITDGADLLGWRERCLDQGIHLDVALVSRLKRMMQASFVPETEASRAGAGPSLLAGLALCLSHECAYRLDKSRAAFFGSKGL